MQMLTSLVKLSIFFTMDFIIMKNPKPSRLTHVLVRSVYLKTLTEKKIQPRMIS